MPTLFFRKQDPTYHSIEGLFEPLAQTLGATALKMPYQSNSLGNLIKNVLYARHNSGAVNHVTGDIHYVMLGLRQKSFNILTIHDCIGLERTSHFHPKYWFYRWFWYTLPIRKADKVAVISEKTKKEIVKLFPFAASKIVVIPNYVSPKFVFSPKKFNSECPVILQIGSNPNKNRVHMIEALKGIKCHIDFIGDVYADEAKLLNAHGITFTSRINLSLSDIIAAYQKADFVFFASTYEGFGMPIIEAQAIGRAVLTSNISPMKEHAGSSAFLVDPYDVDNIRDGILTLIHNAELREKIIEQGLKNVEKYTFDHFFKQYSQLYSQNAFALNA